MKKRKIILIVCFCLAIVGIMFAFKSIGEPITSKNFILAVVIMIPATIVGFITLSKIEKEEEGKNKKEGEEE